MLFLIQMSHMYSIQKMSINLAHDNFKFDFYCASRSILKSGKDDCQLDMPNVHYQPVNCNKFTLSHSLSVAYQFCSTLEPTNEFLKYPLTQESHTITFITLLLNTKFLGKPSKDDIRRIFFLDEELLQTTFKNIRSS